MSDIFYGVGFLIILLNISCLFKYRRIFEVKEWLFKYKKVTGKNPTKDDFRNKNDIELLLTWSYTVIVTVIWMIFGLLSTNWIIFIILFMSNILLNAVSNLLDKYQSIKLFIKFIKSLIVTIVITFLIVNHYHLKIDIFQYVKQLLLNC
jgi:hypothetical protein